MNDKHRTRNARVEVLATMWDRLVDASQAKATALKDNHMKEMTKKMRLIPGHLKITVLRYFNQKCRELHALAFLQWRLKFPSKLNYDEKDLRFLI